ncbi:phosphotransferase family protein [Glycomyces arizonensis]|uniref:phosphotransferase family protein n=1 Tax=Glycomyces arizonensis TaxID=256035 RepID=UPI000423F60C|nr:aminoglycoside 3'-phosphotransferase/choline kinase family protein [Glycomyces arizonensis]
MLPAVHDEADWEAVVEDDAVVRPAALDLLARLGLAEEPFERYTTGSMPVYAIGDSRVLKLYPTVCADSAAVEARVLEHLHGRLPVPTPELLAEGDCENGWRYVLMSQLAGEGLAPAWPRIPAAARDRLAESIGETLAAMHGLDTAALGGSLAPPDWRAFVAEQRSTAVERQRSLGLCEPWLEQIPAFLESVRLVHGDGRSLLHTEVMREHLLVDPRTWAPSGLFDFEPAMIGDGAYEFAAVGVYTALGDTRFLDRIMAAYGRAFTPDEVLAQLLLHIEGNLPRYFKILPEPPEPTLESMAATWFGTD